ncbi:MAG: ABC transporter ATP-binding protein, partial [Clostridia bacterium]|nr:ABC transporter ATP-binding protein [Clostridia bacterium]
GILGPKGAGKSALARLVAGILLPDEGELILGETVPQGEQERLLWKRRIGYMPTDLRAYEDMTLFELLCFVGETKGIEEDRLFRQSTEALRLVGLADYSACTVRRLRLHQQRKLGLAATLIGNAETLILDDPTAGLGRSQAEELRNLIAMLETKKQILLFTHDPKEAEALCHTVLMLSGGKQVAYSSVEDILQRLNRTETAVLAVSLRGVAAEEVCRSLRTLGGVLSCVSTEETGGVCRLQLEAEPSYDRRKGIEKHLTAEGVSLLSYDTVTFHLSDAFEALTEPKVSEQPQRKSRLKIRRKEADR